MCVFIFAESTLSGERGTTTAASKDVLTDILGPHFNLVSMVRQTGKSLYSLIK